MRGIQHREKSREEVEDVVREAGGRGGKANESTHLSFFCQHRIAVLFFWRTLSLFQMGPVYVSVFVVSIGLTKDRERSGTVACVRFYN